MKSALYGEKEPGREGEAKVGEGAQSGPIVVEGRNCWRRARAGRAAFLVDAAAYFEALAAAVERARESVIIVGWDIDSRIALVRGNGVEPAGAKLVDFFNSVLKRRSRLRAYILIWDFAMIYALEREPLPIYTLGWRTHRRLRFAFDGTHPLGASHHQKIVVVDDQVAFVGGLDITKCRWDTPEHRSDDPRRFDPWCGRYGPFHDVQMAVDGEAARALGELARERWRRATGQRLPSVSANGSDPWPAGLTPELENVLIGIARTQPAYEGFPEVREVEVLYRDAILAARRFIYIETQYFTSASICDVLASRLQERDGPEVVMVLPFKSSGWLEEKTMDILRAKLLLELRAADRFDRLRIYYPGVPGSGYLNVHSKVLIVDDGLVRIGSSNLSNRSMGLDTECDLAVEADGDDGVSKAIAGFRNRLLGEHLGVPAQRVADMIKRKGSLVEALESLRGAERTLEPLDGKIPNPSESWIYESGLIDPERPADVASLVDQFVPEEVKRSGGGRVAVSVIVLLSLLALAAAWRWTPLRQWLDLDLLAFWASFARRSPLAPFLVMVAFTIGGLIMFPVTLLIVATAVTFDPLPAFFYSLLGSLSSAVAAFGVGNVMGRETVRRLAGARLNRLTRRLRRQGLIMVVTLRLFPVAPYTVINIVAGASHIRFKDYLIGTVIGLSPGLLAITFLGTRLQEAIEHPRLENFFVFAGFVALIVAANIVIHRWMARKGHGPEPGKASRSETN